ETEQLTIGGYVFNLFGSLPEIGDKISDENCDYEVLRMDGTRVSLVKVTKRCEQELQERDENKNE
ncbi:transporter associated domain-containing protein, partial [uncultured Campylobacter sp.]